MHVEPLDWFVETLLLFCFPQASMPRLLIYCIEAFAGLGDYTHSQAEAIANATVQVTLLAPADFILQSTLGVPLSVPLLLCFGRLRNDKTLNRVLQALASHPTAHLVVAGPEATPGQLQSSNYQRLAQSLGVDNRCHWQIHFHTPQEVANVFAAVDVAVLAYSASFRSASCMLNVVASDRLPAVASSGDSALLSAVKRFRLGVAVPPDDTSALTTGSDGLRRSDA